MNRRFLPEMPWKGWNSECRYARLLLWDYAEGRLSVDEEARVGLHLADCAACRTAVEEQEATRTGLSAYREQPFPSAVGDWQSVRTQLPLTTPGQPANYRTGGWGRRQAGMAWAAGAAVLALIAIAGRQFLFSGPGRPQAGGIAPTVVKTIVPPKTSTDGKTARQQKQIVHDQRPQRPNTDGVVPPSVRSPKGTYTFDRPMPPSGIMPGPEPRPEGVPVITDDTTYINGNSVAAVSNWAQIPKDQIEAIRARVDAQAKRGDDFVQVPFPALASSDSRGLEAAATAYKQQKEIVDARLAQNVTVSVKATAFSELCKQLRDSTGIEMKAARSVADDKATIFCTNVPLRDLMRQINHVFGFTWARQGEPGKYEYELTQDLRSQLAEQELCNRDINAAMVDMDSQVKDSAAYKDRETGLGVDVYHHLSPADAAALRSGKTVQFNGWSDDPAHRLSPEQSQTVVKTFPRLMTDKGVFNDLPGVQGMITLHIDRTELGQLTLKSGVQIHEVKSDGSLGGGFGGDHTIATGKSPSTAKPENAKTNEGLRRDAALQKSVSLHPKSSCIQKIEEENTDPQTRFGFNPDNAIDSSAGFDRMNRKLANVSHVSSADVWEEVHKQTGLPIVADSYLHLYATSSVSVQSMPLYDALSQVADAMGARWKKEDGFLQGRSASFFWDRRKEIPNRLLDRWQADSRKNGGLPLEDLLEMALLSDEQLNSQIVGDAVHHCRGLYEWDTLQRSIGFYSPRPFARLLARASAAARRAFFAPEGIAFSSFTPKQRQELLGFLLEERSYLADMPQVLTASSFRMDYVPSGWYVWRPEYTINEDKQGKKQLEINRLPLAFGRTKEEALAAARKYDPKVPENHIKLSPGILSVTQHDDKGDAYLLQGLRPMRVFGPPPDIKPF